MTDFAFLPNTFTVPAGEEISIVATYNGATAHSLLVMEHGRQIRDHFSSQDKPGIYWQLERVLPGESIDSVFRAPKEAGVYQIVCGIAGHFEAGMVAKLVVVASP
jgi:uncharacterized cupredoxin-like copper-binding protein